MRKIKVALAGIGNCASSLVQGIYYYWDIREDEFVPGLMHTVLGGYRISDVEFVAAFDVDERKVGRDLSEAIFSKPNCVPKFADVPKIGVKVLKGPVLDGVAPHMKTMKYGEGFLVNDDNDPVDVSTVLEETDPDVLINFTPVGSHDATRHYAESALKAKVAFINGIPEFIASDPKWARKFEENGLPVAGDDVKSQVGATILHRAIVDLLVNRGVKIEETYQLNIGGNMDFLNMIEEDRLKTKRISKTEAVTSLVPYSVPTRIGPSDYVDFTGDRKICYIWVKGRNFGDFPVYIDLKLSVMDSPNSIGTVIDVIRTVKLALDRGIAGPLTSISAYAFKHPPKQFPDAVAKRMVEEFIEGKRER